MNTNGYDELVRNVTIVQRDEFFNRVLNPGQPLLVKAGFDPTSPDLHLGHLVLLKKLREFQDMGHKVVVVIGDATAMIGDPTGRNKARPPLSKESIDSSALSFLDQVRRILRPRNLEIVKNSAWLNTMMMPDVIKLMSSMTVAKMLARRDFSDRHEAGTPIHMHEFLYPLLQGFDSMHLKPDIEIGGSDLVLVEI